MIKVIQWSRPGWEEIITYEECDKRIAASKARGEDVRTGMGRVTMTLQHRIKTLNNFILSPFAAKNP